MYVFSNSRIISEEQAHIHIQDRGFLLGDGIFETLKVQNGHIQFFEDHYNRLIDSANKLSIPLNYSAKQIKIICIKLLLKNKLAEETASLRITLTRGIGLRGIQISDTAESTFFISASKYENKKIQPRALITSILRNPFSPIIKLKTLNYLEPIFARFEAQSKNFDEGIMLNINKCIAECATANIFFVKNNVVITPSIETGILPGIVRDKVISLCKKNNILVYEKIISQEEALDADEAFQTNSLIGIQPLSAINDKKFSIENFKITPMLIEWLEQICAM